jgi:hypothetical protein
LQPLLRRSIIHRWSRRRTETGDFDFLDVRNVLVLETKNLECDLTLRDGQVAWDLNGRAGGE